MRPPYPSLLVVMMAASHAIAFLPPPPPPSRITPPAPTITTTSLYSESNGGGGGGGFDFMQMWNDFITQITGGDVGAKKEEVKQEEPPAPPTPPEQVDVVVVGGGISGCTTAFYLDKTGADVLLAEARGALGGNVISKNEEGYVWEEGPNTFQPADHVMRAIVDLDLKEELQLSEPSLPRYVYWEGQLYKLPSGPGDLLDFDLLSWPGKLRAAVGALGFVDAPPEGYEESVKEFVTRHLGDEAFERVVDPFVGGVYAGDPAKLSAKAALKKIQQLEEVGGPGILDGFIIRVQELKKRIRDKDLPDYEETQFGSFKGGLQAYPKAVAEKLGDKVRTQWSLQSIEKTEEGTYISNFTAPSPTNSSIPTTRQVESKAVAITAPAHVINSLLRPLVPEVERLQQVYYPPVASVTLSYPTSAFKSITSMWDADSNPLKGFGHFLPRAMKLRTLGTIWTSSLFPGRAPDGHHLLLSYIGGAQDPGIASLSQEEIIQQVHQDIKKVLLKEDAPEPKVLGCRLWPTAIPQYGKGHLQVMEEMEKAVEKFPGLFLGGSYKTGIAFQDCIQYGQEEASRVKAYLKEVLPPKPMYPYRY